MLTACHANCTSKPGRRKDNPLNSPRLQIITFSVVVCIPQLLRDIYIILPKWDRTRHAVLQPAFPFNNMLSKSFHISEYKYTSRLLMVAQHSVCVSPATEPMDLLLAGMEMVPMFSLDHDCHRDDNLACVFLCLSKELFEMNSQR